MQWYFVVLDGLETVPEVAAVADQIPPDLLGIEIEVAKLLIIPLLHSLQLFLGALLAIGQRHDTRHFRLIIQQRTVELAVDVGMLLELLSVAQDLDVAHRIDFYLVELELKTHMLC